MEIVLLILAEPVTFKTADMRYIDRRNSLLCLRHPDLFALSDSGKANGQ
jgi:hypothetical protein